MILGGRSLGTTTLGSSGSQGRAAFGSINIPHQVVVSIATQQRRAAIGNLAIPLQMAIAVATQQRRNAVGSVAVPIFLLNGTGVNDIPVLHTAPIEAAFTPTPRMSVTFTTTPTGVIFTRGY